MFSKIDALNGAIGVIPEESVPLAFTNEYLVYDLKTKGRVSVEYAQLLCRTKTFMAQIEALVVGHTGRRRIHREEFENLLVPIPSHQEQAEIVRYERRRADETSSTRRRALQHVAAAIDQVTTLLGLQSPELEPITRPFAVRLSQLIRWSPRNAIGPALGISNELKATYPVELLGDLADVAYGLAKSPSNRPNEFPRPYLRVANVQDGYLDLSEVKTIDVPPENFPGYRLEPGDLLVCEGNSFDLVGRPAIWNGEIDGCIHQNHILRIRSCGRLRPNYILAYLNTAPARGHFRDRAKETTNLATINSSDVKELPIPTPPKAVQVQIERIYTAARDAQQRDLATADELEQATRMNIEAAISSGAALD